MPRPRDDRKPVRLCPGEVLRALELHVLDKVRQAALVVVFRTDPALTTSRSSTCARPWVRPDVKAQAVGQAADEDFRIDRHIGRKRVAGDRCGGCLAAGCCRGLRGQLGRSNEQTGDEAGGRSPEQAQGGGATDRGGFKGHSLGNSGSSVRRCGAESSHRMLAASRLNEVRRASALQRPSLGFAWMRRTGLEQLAANSRQIPVVRPRPMELAGGG